MSIVKKRKISSKVNYLFVKDIDKTKLLPFDLFMCIFGLDKEWLSQKTSFMKVIDLLKSINKEEFYHGFEQLTARIITKGRLDYLKLLEINGLSVDYTKLPDPARVIERDCSWDEGLFMLDRGIFSCIIAGMNEPDYTLLMRRRRIMYILSIWRKKKRTNVGLFNYSWFNKDVLWSIAKSLVDIERKEAGI